jgi:endo-1,4-beta-xylanase
MRSLIYLFSLVLVFSATTVTAQDNLIYENDFEKGTRGWEARGTGRVSIERTKKQFASGERSLQVQGRTESWQGAQINVTKYLKPGQIYQFSVSVRVDEDDKTDDIRMTMERGNKNFSAVGIVKGKPGEWTKLSGRFQPTGKDPYLLLYIEAAGNTTSFFIDDFKLEAAAPPEQKGVLIKNDFEDGTAQNWLVLGESVKMFSVADESGKRSLRVSDRTEEWHGLALDLSAQLFKDRTYQFSADVKLALGESKDKLKMMMRQTDADGKMTFIEIAPAAAVTDDEWLTLKGEFKPETWGNNFLVYVEAEGKKTSFYLDNFQVSVP